MVDKGIVTQDILERDQEAQDHSEQKAEEAQHTESGTEILACTPNGFSVFISYIDQINYGIFFLPNLFVLILSLP